MNTMENQKEIFPKGEKTSADYFTGTAWINIIVPQDETGSYTIGNVIFEPGCRTNWHTHTCGQILFVTQLLPYVGYPRTLNAIKCLNEVIPE